MNLNRGNIRKIRGLVLFTAVVILALLKFDLLWMTVIFCLGILRPFIVGGMIAYVINLPMRFYEKKLFSGRKGKPAGKWMEKCRRGLSLVLAYLSVILAITLVIVTVIPQLAGAVRILANRMPVLYGI